MPGWTAAHSRLLTIFPNAQAAIAAPYSMTPDRILEAADAVGAVSDSVLLYNPWRGAPEGRGNKPFEEYENLELFDVVFGEKSPSPGPLWFIPDDCFSNRREPYLMHGEQLRDSIASCPCSLIQDVLFIWCECPRVTVIHHEGGYFHLVASAD
jgi:hypothetical protein